MKKLLLELFKEQAVDARIKDRYDEFVNSPLYKYMSKNFDLTKIGE